MTPRATYRLQFNKSFPFDQAASLAAYLKELGISHVYASPYLQARPDSKHGYDITDHNALNAELGGVQAFERMLASFREHGLEHILDYVPNHMGVGGSDNPIWLDVLQWGRESQYFGWFDIDWHSHAESLSEKLLVPFLGDQYGKELESGKIELKFDPQAGEFSVWLYGTHKLPVAPATYAEIVGQRTLPLERLADEFAALPEVRSELRRRAAELKTQLVNLVSKDPASRSGIEEELKTFGGQPGQLSTWKKLDHLIRQQHWRPTHFRVAADDINYRRFFNISDLAGIRMELPEVFELTHRLVIRLIREGKLQGLRIDHIDGLFNPKEYLQRLRAAVGSPFYLVVEKILATHEGLRQDWPVEGTTGYDFCAEVTALLVDPAAEQAFTDLYLGFTGETEPFARIVRRSKIKIMENEMGSELESLAREAARIAQQNARTIDFTQNILLRALKEIIACFPVYRTYVDGNGREETDERYIHWAVSQAINNEKEVDASAFEFLENLLTARLAEETGSGFSRHAVLRFAMRAQQFSGPVMAKGLEDTALYRYNRFIALNDVGSMPDQFGLSVHAFHKENQHRAEKWPHTMLGTSTHDVKRGEDARARLAALSLIPDEWAGKVDTWNRILRARRGDVEGTAPPSRNDEYLFFQNLVGTWPAELTPPHSLDAKEVASYCERLCAAMTKSLREARVRSNWTSPNTPYEEALSEFIREALNPERSATFFESFLPFQQRLAQLGLHNSLVQTFLKATCPGVPDFYQGSELWCLSLPDPDNRRPIDFEVRREFLPKLKGKLNGDRLSCLKELRKNWHDAAIKLALTQILLHIRQESAELFESSIYTPIVLAEDAPRVCAFSRSTNTQTMIAVAALDARMDSTKLSIGLPLTTHADLTQWRDLITGRTLTASHATLPLSQLFEILPVALLAPA